MEQTCSSKGKYVTSMLQVLRNEAGQYQALRPLFSKITRVLYFSRPPLNTLSALKEQLLISSYASA